MVFPHFCLDRYSFWLSSWIDSWIGFLGLALFFKLQSISQVMFFSVGLSGSNHSVRLLLSSVLVSLEAHFLPSLIAMLLFWWGWRITKNLLGPTFMQNVGYSPLAFLTCVLISLLWVLLATNSMDPGRVNQYYNKLIRTYDMHTQFFSSTPWWTPGGTKAWYNLGALWLYVPFYWYYLSSNMTPKGT